MNNVIDGLMQDDRISLLFNFNYAGRKEYEQNHLVVDEFLNAFDKKYGSQCLSAMYGGEFTEKEMKSEDFMGQFKSPLVFCVGKQNGVVELFCNVALLASYLKGYAEKCGYDFSDDLFIYAAQKLSDEAAEYFGGEGEQAVRDMLDEEGVRYKGK